MKYLDHPNIGTLYVHLLLIVYCIRPLLMLCVYECVCVCVSVCVCMCVRTPCAHMHMCAASMLDLTFIQWVWVCIYTYVRRYVGICVWVYVCV